MKKIIFSLIALMITTICNAQNDVEMADTFRQEGKIYVVIGVLLIIFLGIVGYLISLDRRLRKLENKG